MQGNVLLVVTLFCLGVQGGDYFDCGRQGQDCANGQACQADGNCDCKTPYSGHDCILQDDDKSAAPCTSITDSCGSDGGLCYKKGGDKACYCPPASVGAQCELKRYDVQCLASSMKIKLLPAGTFSGVVYVNGQRDVAGCKTTETSASGYLELDLQDSACGGMISDTNTGARSRAVIVQYNSKYVTNLDTKVTVTCRNEAGTVEVTQTFSSENSNGNIHEQNINSSVDIDSSAVEFEIKQKDGTPVSSSTAVSLDDQLTFEFVGGNSCRFQSYPHKQGPVDVKYELVGDLTQCKEKCESDSNCTALNFNQAGYMALCAIYTRVIVNLTDIYLNHYTKECLQDDAIRVESCTASNGQSGDDQETLKLIDHSCPSSEAGKLMEESPTKVTNTTVTFKLHPFKFNKVNAITVTCTVKVCPTGTAAQCDALDCSGQTRRKRRSAEISDVTIRKTFIILDPNLELTRTHDSSKESSVSVDDITTPIVAGVAMVIILLLVISIVVLLVVKKRRTNRKSQEDGVNKQKI
ncbi:EGF-like domain-containing protein 1 isoform X2 [Gigantopelta aegis]|uniref:EGF-like domain-containing protein 1 isoform X2 n=1 Tax=Gigantopelta aegis TaxID=1735272 RepID=UPI001B88A1E2|nr:EGF-like domain-containing protein 1 isoform X2 [Gigantopelta aegis]